MEREFLRTLLRQARHRMRVSQKELAVRLGKRQSYVSDIEQGKRRVDLVELRAICSALGTSLTDFAAEFERAVDSAEPGEPAK